jgi:hypothetical protein
MNPTGKEADMTTDKDLKARLLAPLPPRKDPAHEFFGEVISGYSREQAIEDGILVDVTETVKEAGIKYPVALTRAVFEKCVALPKRYRGLEDERGRLWDVLSMFRFAARATSGDLLHYRLMVSRRTVILKAMIGPGDTPEPVVTIMLPEED